MKKLIISMVATASIALVAKADVFNSTSFEGLNLGAITADNKGAFLDENGKTYWTGYSADSDLAVKELGAEGGLRAKPEGLARPLTGDDAKALAIDVDTPLARNINATEEDAGVPQAIGNGLYFDSMVQFTATTEAPRVTDGDKLIVWLKENEIEGEDSTYALWVTAGVWDEVKAERCDYEITNVNVAPDSWHRLSIAVKMVETEDGDIPTFKVYVDGAEAKAGDVADFQSLVYDDGGTLWKQITSVSFQGKGAIDDLVWTDEDPFYVAPDTTDVVVTLTKPDADTVAFWNCEYATASDGEVTIEDTTVKGLIVGKTVVFSCTTFAGYTVEGFDSQEDEGTIKWTKSVVVSEDLTKFEIKITKNPKPVAKPFTVTIAGETKQFGTLADAIAAANGATIKLTEDATLTEKLTVAEAAVIDLNGQTLNLAETDNYAVVVKAALTITDSSSEKSGTVVVPGEYGFGMTAGSLTINAGNFVATDADYLIGAWAGTVAISGGAFTAEYCVVNLFAAAASAEISGGMFTVAEESDGYPCYAILSEVGGKVAVSAGRFSTIVEEAFCAEGYIPTTEADSGYYTVVRGYAVTVEADDNAEVSALAAKYAAGATVTFTVTPATDYEVTGVTAVTADGEDVSITANVSGYTFEMPAKAVTITVTTEETYKEPTVEPNGDETITEPISDTAKDIIKDQFPAGGVVIKVEVNGDTLKGDAAVKMINKVVDMFKGTPFVVDDQGVAKLELVFKVDDVMAIVNGLTGGYTLKAGNATFNTEAYEVVPRWYDIDKKVWDVDAPQDGATKGFFKLKVQKKAN